MFPRQGRGLHTVAEGVNDELWRRAKKGKHLHVFAIWEMDSVIQPAQMFGTDILTLDMIVTGFVLFSQISTSDVIFSVLLAEVGEGHGVLDVDGELLCVAEHGLVQGEELVILHGAPGGDLTQVPPV